MEKLSSYMPEIIVADRKPEMSNGERPSIWQAALNALAEGDIDETVDQFDDQFTFTDHALALELKRKDQLYGYFRKIREFFPESERTDHTLFSSGDVIFSQWRMAVIRNKPFLNGHFRKVESEAHGISVVRVSDGRIVQWSEYYDQTGLQRFCLQD